MLPACATIGILGGGQLGRMTALAAARLGYKTHIYTAEEHSPAGQVAARTFVAPYNHAKSLKQFAQSVDVVTFEFENIPAEAVHILSEIAPVHPRYECLYIAQNRLREKALASELGFATAPYRPVSSAKQLEAAFVEIGLNGAILKTAELGYDGKGQVRIARREECEAAWEQIGNGRQCVLEGMVDFSTEISVIVARGTTGQVVAYDVCENTHEGGILRQTRLPSVVSREVAREATSKAITMAERMDLIGLLAVEFFITREGEVLVNEMAPRPHNSGHWTMDAAATCQFEQLVRAVAGLPLGSTQLLYPVEMHNIIGEEVTAWPRYLEQANARLHLYGKTRIVPGRKMGHVNYIQLVE